VSHKSGKVVDLLTRLGVPQQGRFDPHYLGYFECFNREMYYEAHDVLEDLWLETKGDDYFFYKGLIQLAGAFVHLKKSKLNPASRLFKLALKNLSPYGPTRKDLDIAKLLNRIHEWIGILESSDYTHNPYDPKSPPHLEIEPVS